jgi:hypothetical protein
MIEEDFKLLLLLAHEFFNYVDWLKGLILKFKTSFLFGDYANT